MRHDNWNPVREIHAVNPLGFGMLQGSPEEWTPKYRKDFSEIHRDRRLLVLDVQNIRGKCLFLVSFVTASNTVSGRELQR